MMPAKPVVGLIGQGEMGAGIGRELVAAGCDVLTCLDGRSPETVARAAEAQVRDVGALDELVSRAQIIFSIVPSSVAAQVGRETAEIAKRQSGDRTFVEANAIAPARARHAASAFADTGVRFVDGGLVGAPPAADRRPRLYVSGAACPLLQQLDGIGFDIVRLGDAAGQASGFKMTYAAMTKGTNALLTAVMLSACEQGFLDVFLREARSSQPVLAKRAEDNVSRLPADARRWAAEMLEIRDTFADLDLPAGFHAAAADIMQRLADSPFGHETRRTRDRSRSMEATIKSIVSESDESGRR